MVHCKKCDNAFRSISALRKHQWSAHPESFDNLKAAAKKAQPKALAAALRTYAQRRKTAELTVRQHKQEPTHQLTNGHKPLLASDLLSKPKVQRGSVERRASTITVTEQGVAAYSAYYRGAPNYRQHEGQLSERVRLMLHIGHLLVVKHAA